MFGGVWYVWVGYADLLEGLGLDRSCKLKLGGRAALV